MKKFIVFFAALSMVLGFAVTAAMADTDLYGSARFRTYWADKDKDYSATGFSDEDLDWRIGYLTRWGVNYKSGDIRGKLEMDTRDIGAPSSTNSGKNGSAELGDVRVRLMYGEWDFGKGKLLIGQNYNPYTFYNSGIGYFSGGLQKIGGMGLKYFRTSQIRLTFGNLVLAFMTPDSSENPAAIPVGGWADTDETLPRMEARYTLNVDPVKIDFIVGWQEYDVVDNTDDEEEITSYLAGINAKANFGPAYVIGAATFRQNGDNYGLWTVVEESAVYENGSIQDNEAWGFQLIAGYKINDTFKVEAAYSMIDSENDDRIGKWEDDASAFALLCNITLAPGVTVQPEFIYYDKEEKYENGVKTNQGDATIFGVFWMINFK